MHRMVTFKISYKTVIQVYLYYSMKLTISAIPITGQIFGIIDACKSGKPERAIPFYNTIDAIVDDLNGEQSKIESKMRSKSSSIDETKARLRDKENEKKKIERQISALESSIKIRQNKITSLESQIQDAGRKKTKAEQQRTITKQKLIDYRSAKDKINQKAIQLERSRSDRSAQIIATRAFKSLHEKYLAID